MNKLQLEHILVSAAKIGDDNEIIVIGSQSILGQFPEAEKNPVLSYSMEADLYLKNKTSHTILVEGSIGEGSMFHMTYGYYAQEVGPQTAILPVGWEDRLFSVQVRYNHQSTVTGYCLEVHDLAVAKYSAGREKDYGFLAVMINKGMLRKKELITRVYKTAGINHQGIIDRIKRDFKDYASRHFDYNKTFGSPTKGLSMTADQNKQAFLKKIKQRTDIK